VFGSAQPRSEAPRECSERQCLCENRENKREAGREGKGKVVKRKACRKPADSKQPSIAAGGVFEPELDRGLSKWLGEEGTKKKGEITEKNSTSEKK